MPHLIIVICLIALVPCAIMARRELRVIRAAVGVTADVRPVHPERRVIDMTDRTFDVAWDGDDQWEPIEAATAALAAAQYVQRVECVMDGDQTVIVKGHGRFFVTEIKGEKVATLLPATSQET